MSIIEQFPRVLILAFRDARKSTNGIRFCKRQIADKHKSVSYFSSTTDKAEEFSERIRADFLMNERILEQYGYILDDDMSNTKQKMFWLFQRNQSTRQAGLSIGSVQGKSQMGGHPDIIILDDPIGEEMVSITSLKAAKRWYTKQIAPMAKGRSRIIVIGTIKHSQDLYNELIRSGMFQVFILKAIEEWPNHNQHKAAPEPNSALWYYTEYKEPNMLNPEIRGVANLKGGKVGFNEYHDDLWNMPGRVIYYVNDNPDNGIDKERMSMQEFLLVRRHIGEIAFEYEYQLNPVPVEAGIFQWDKIKYFNLDMKLNLPPLQDLFSHVYAFFDQSFGSTTRADLNAIAVMGKVETSQEKRFYLLDLITWQGEGGVARKIQMIQQVFEKWPMIIEMGVEADVINSEDQKTIETVLNNLPIKAVYQRQMGRGEMGIESPRVNFEIPPDIPTNKHSKIRRTINYLDATISLGLFYVNEAMTEREVFENCSSFPYCEKLDPMDAIGTVKYLCDSSFSAADFGWGGGYRDPLL